MFYCLQLIVAKEITQYGSSLGRLFINAVETAIAAGHCSAARPVSFADKINRYKFLIMLDEYELAHVCGKLTGI